MKINNVMTNIVGRAKTERIIGALTWKNEVKPILDLLMAKTSVKTHKALIGKWIVELIGNDDHMHEFFVKNWQLTNPKLEPVIHCYVLTGVQDRAAMMKLLGLKTEADLKAHRDSFLTAIEDKKYRNSLRDKRLSEIANYPESEQIEIALFAPATIYSSEDRVFVSLNTNYYGQLKSKSSLGPLEEFLTRKAKVDASGKIVNPDEVWLSMHAGCVEYWTEQKKQRAIVIIAPTGTGKSTHGYGLVEAKKENRLHSDDWVFTNIGTREVLISENRFYMRTNIAEIYPHLIPLLVNQPLENVAFTPDIVELLQKFESQDDLRAGFKDGRVSAEQYQKIVEQMIETNAARSLIDPRLMVGKEKFVERATLTDLFLMKRDYDSAMLIKQIGEDEMVEILTSKGNVFNYIYGKSDADGYGIAQKRTTEIYYNPYLCICEVDREEGKIGDYDKIRIESYRMLARNPSVKVTWINTRLHASQIQLCIRIYLESDFDQADIQKGKAVTPELLAALRLKSKNKPQVEGRREMDLVGFFDSEDREVEIVLFMRQGKPQEAIAFSKVRSGIASYAIWDESEKCTAARPEDFFKKYENIGARALLESRS
jgi:hypothetical protein